MSLRIEESFELHAPVDRAWRYLVDPRQVVHCLPGAYDGRVTITGRDDAAHVVSIVGEGRERSAPGATKMTLTMTSRLTPLSATATRVQVIADVDILDETEPVGAGLIQSANEQLFKQFTERLRGTLEEPVAEMGDFMAEPPPMAWVPAPPSPRSALPRIAGLMPAIPAPPIRPLGLAPLVMRRSIEWLRRVGAALVGRPRHP
jgi:carbon monoxide dehydrogenase subunit G